MDIRIVEYDPSLAGTLAKMWNDSNDDWGGGNEAKTPGQVMQRIEGSSIMHHYVAMAGDEAVGYASLGRYFGDADALYIELLGVRPDFQGKKVGKALVLKCVERTIELGYPRLDIHTWPGNTAAMPLYKKCGYLWEDRADSTHLVNFIPEILGTGLFKPFFAKADWYMDSARSWEAVPDEAKVNKFGIFGYLWEKDGGTLAVGYERTGRRMRLIETDDYKIELMAEGHELAFGLTYGCTFSVTNKSGVPLHVKINGKTDRNIRFDFALDEQLNAVTPEPLVYNGTFHVGEITELQDKWKVHPCVLADVEINGEAVTFGLGICTKYPLNVYFSTEHKVQQVGMTADCFINITSALSQDAEVTFTLTEDRLGDIMQNGTPQNTFTTRITAEGKTNIPVMVKYKEIGYEAAPTHFNIALADGTRFSFTKALHLSTQDLTHAFHGENDYNYYIVNGPWRVRLDKQDNESAISHLTNPTFDKGWFSPPKFGKPYDDEFNLLKPTVRCFPRGAEMVMEAEYLSEKFTGMALTMIFTLNAVGIVTRSFRVENRGTTPRDIFLNDSYWLALGEHTTFKYRGQFTQNHDYPHADGPFYGIDCIDPKDFEENWIFEAAPAGGRGFCWPPELKPGFQWGNMAIFETVLGHMEPGDVVETPPVICVYGLFNNFGDFRNYAMQLCDRKNYIPARRVEVCLNGYNSFLPPVADVGSADDADDVEEVLENNTNRKSPKGKIADGKSILADGKNILNEIILEILNQRETTLAGKISVSSDFFETQTVVNEDDDKDDDAEIATPNGNNTMDVTDDDEDDTTAGDEDNDDDITNDEDGDNESGSFDEGENYESRAADEDESTEDCDEDEANDNKDEEKTNSFVNRFILPTANIYTVPGGIATIRVDMNLSTYDKSYNRVLFAPAGSITNAQSGTCHTVDNGKITFRADTAYGPVCYSLTTPDGTEWLTHQYPEHKPFAWFNPFLGGIRMIPDEMDNASLLKEKSTADFVTVTDHHGNLWEGIRVTMTVNEEDSLRGAIYESYFVTQPGLPLLCAFYRFINGTGIYRSDTMEMDAFITPVPEGEAFHVEITDKHGMNHRMQFGAGADMGENFTNIVKIIGSRPQKLYVFHGNKNNGKSNEVNGDTKYPLGVDVYMQCHAAPGKSFTSSPMVLLLTPQDLEKDSLDDLERLEFTCPD